MRFVFLVSSIFLSLFSIGNAQEELKEDRKAEDYFKKGEAEMEAVNYPKAIKYFEQASERKFNRVTTASIYMAGLANHYANDHDAAIGYFQNLITNYPKSIYVDEARFHKGLSMLQKKLTKKGGLYLLVNLADETHDDSLRTQVLNAIKNFLFYEAETDFLEEYYPICRIKLKDLVFEAICYQYYKSGNIIKLKEFLSNYGKLHKNILLKYKNNEIESIEVNTNNKKLKYFKIALLLPFFAANGDTAFMVNGARWSAEILEGFQIASELNPPQNGFLLEVKVVDTRKDTFLTARIMREVIIPFQPNIVVGEIFNGPTKVISNFCAKDSIVQLVPLSPSADLIEKNKNVFLFASSMETQQKKIVSWVVDSLKAKKVAIIADENNTCDLLALNLKRNLQERKIYPTYRKIRGRSTEQLNSEVLKLTQEIETESPQVLYIPTMNEYFLGNFLRKLDEKGIKPFLIGTSDYGKFKQIDKSLLSNFNTIYPETYYSQNDTARFNTFTIAYNEKWHKSPSRYATLGADIYNYIKNGIELNYKNEPNSNNNIQTIISQPPYKGLAQNIYFAQNNDNQAVILVQYKNGKLQRLKTW